MRHLGLVATTSLGLITLIAGLGCGSVPPLLPGGAASPMPEATAAQSAPAIPEGIYTGQLTTRTMTFIDGDLDNEDTMTATSTHVFGPDGLVLTDSGEPVRVGFRRSVPLGFGNADLVATSVRKARNGLVLKYDMTLSLTIENEVAVLKGQGTESWKLSPTGSLQYTDSPFLFGFFRGHIMTQQQETTGTLVR